MKRGADKVVHDRVIVALLLVAVLTVSIIHIIGPVKVYDDAFITYRYVENIHQGRGAVYNEGERVLGVTSPLFLLWLTLLRLFLPGIDLPALAVWGNLFFLLAATGLVLAYVRSLDLGNRAAAVAAIAVILSGPILRVSMGGMEASLFLALVFAVLLVQRHGWPGAALCIASLAALTRPEGLLLVGIVVATILLDVERRRLAWLLGLLPLVVWTAWSSWYYGSPIPHSIIAKAQPLYPQPAGKALLDLIREMGAWTVGGLFTGLEVLAGKPDPGLAFPTAPLLVVGVIVTVWIAWRWKRAVGQSGKPGWWMLPVFLLSYVIFYAIGNPLMFAWYYPPFQACWIVLAVVASLGPPERRALPVKSLNVVVLSLVLITAVTSFIIALPPGRRSLLDHGAVGDGRFEVMAAYARAAAWVERHSALTDRVAAPEIGILGYKLDRKILDACGLVSPEAIPFLPVPPAQRRDRQGVISTDFVKATRPEWVVTNPLHAMHSLLVSPWFLDQYEEAYQAHAELDGQVALTVLVFRKLE